MPRTRLWRTFECVALCQLDESPPGQARKRLGETCTGRWRCLSGRLRGRDAFLIDSVRWEENLSGSSPDTMKFFQTQTPWWKPHDYKTSFSSLTKRKGRKRGKKRNRGEERKKEGWAWVGSLFLPSECRHRREREDSIRSREKKIRQPARRLQEEEKEKNRRKVTDTSDKK